MIKAVIFDWDGVLVNSVPSYFAAFKKVLANHKARFLPEYYHRFNGPTIREIFEIVQKEQQLTFDVNEAVRERDALLDEALRNAPLFPHAQELVQALRARGLKTAIASGAPRKQIDAKLVNDLQMDAVVTAEDVRQGKPHPEVYLHAAEMLGVLPSECIVLEDSPVGIQAAKSAGMKVIAITHTTTADALADANAIITNLNEAFQHISTKPRVVAVVQARLGSSRFPEKILKDIRGIPMLQFLVSRLQKVSKITDIIIATTDNPKDDKLATFCTARGWKFFRGSEEDVLDRYYQTAKTFDADVIVRITGDCPLSDPSIIDQVIADFEKGGADYVCNVKPPTYPDGLDVEVLSFDALERAWKISREKPNLALVTGHIWNHPDQFRMRNVRNEKDLSSYRFTVDYPEDLDFVNRLCSLLPENFTFKDMISAIEEHPELRDLNARFKRNEGMLFDMKKLAEGKKQ